MYPSNSNTIILDLKHLQALTHQYQCSDQPTIVSTLGSASNIDQGGNKASSTNYISLRHINLELEKMNAEPRKNVFVTQLHDRYTQGCSLQFIPNMSIYILVHQMYNSVTLFFLCITLQKQCLHPTNSIIKKGKFILVPSLSLSINLVQCFYSLFWDGWFGFWIDLFPLLKPDLAIVFYIFLSVSMDVNITHIT